MLLASRALVVRRACLVERVISLHRSGVTALELVSERAGLCESGSQPAPGPVVVGCDTSRDTRAEAKGRHMAYASGSIAA